MSAHDGAVDHGVFVVGIGSEMLKYPLPDAGFGPAGKPCVDLDRVAEALRQIAPRDARTITVEHRLDKQPVVAGRHPNLPLAARQ